MFDNAPSTVEVGPMAFHRGLQNQCEEKVWAEVLLGQSLERWNAAAAAGRL